MLSPEVHEEWRKQVTAAALRYDEAKRHVVETAIERLLLPKPDGDFAHQRALRDEMQALRQYTNLLADFSRLLVKESEEGG